jgi:serine/threonine protein kinase
VVTECLVQSVHHLHTAFGLVHHDLKLRNFVRFFDGRYRLVDFDNARVAEREDMGLTTANIAPPGEISWRQYRTAHLLRLQLEAARAYLLAHGAF